MGGQGRLRTRDEEGRLGPSWAMREAGIWRWVELSATAQRGSLVLFKSAYYLLLPTYLLPTAYHLLLTYLLLTADC